MSILYGLQSMAKHEKLSTTYGFRPGEGTLGISEWGCAAGTLEPLASTRASSAEFWYPVRE